MPHAASRVWFWVWICLAFFLGVVFGAVGLVVLLQVLTVMISLP